MGIEVGQQVKVSRIFDAATVRAYAELTGDFNPVHFDAGYAADTIFGKPIVHGPLVLTLITTLFANELPGPGSVYLSHDVKYQLPVFYDDEITAILTVTAINEKQHVFIETLAINQNGQTVISGMARLKKY
ncbi:MaoC family dehydratase [Flavobacterium caeni]|uniref:3-hydroxybutyryl-CoA dehydratase n=1 Tax=Flavobacterium caeni TaxID=490189 RepID=A0A1G5FKB8_9FLAO|nr:MaoC family dehydratase [Flavobacterium caeni]SCY39591.1 3-hydroxybutyryl-CoA dehydratase [Flavobacterium caeni]